MAETIGSLVDKLSIIQLKIFYMNRQLERTDADNQHKKEAAQRIKIMQKQKKDLEIELSDLFENVKSGKTKLKIYRQFKMYNDPKYRVKK
ncbi:MAG: DUF4254 domain-containing protein [Elusimicrobia bacterium]|nr:DUF4254 domain-containing protein [Elusimicrobiota bacterium]